MYCAASSRGPTRCLRLRYLRLRCLLASCLRRSCLRLGRLRLGRRRLRSCLLLGCLRLGRFPLRRLPLRRLTRPRHLRHFRLDCRSGPRSLSNSSGTSRGRPLLYHRHAAGFRHGFRRLRHPGRRNMLVSRRLVPQLVGDQQQLADPGEHAAQGLRRSLLDTVTHRRHAHVTLSLGRVWISPGIPAYPSTSLLVSACSLPGNLPVFLSRSATMT